MTEDLKTPPADAELPDRAPRVTPAAACNAHETCIAADLARALPEPAFGYEEHGGGAQFSADQLRALMAERDAAREERDAALERAEFCLAFTRDAQALCATAQEEAAALRLELDALRATAANVVKARDDFGWSSDTDAAINALRGTSAEGGAA